MSTRRSPRYITEHSFTLLSNDSDIDDSGIGEPVIIANTAHQILDLSVSKIEGDRLNASPDQIHIEFIVDESRILIHPTFGEAILKRLVNRRPETLLAHPREYHVQYAVDAYSGNRVEQAHAFADSVLPVLGLTSRIKRLDVVSKDGPQSVSEVCFDSVRDE